jgi:hypothetical protein
MWDTASLFHVPTSIAEQALVDICAVVCDMPISLAPMATLIVLIWTVFSPIGEIVEPCVEHGPRDARGHWGIVEDAWLELVEGISTGQGA